MGKEIGTCLICSWLALAETKTLNYANKAQVGYSLLLLFFKKKNLFAFSSLTHMLAVKIKDLERERKSQSKKSYAYVHNRKNP